jgi:hypothetical protein
MLTESEGNPPLDFRSAGFFAIMSPRGASQLSQRIADEPAKSNPRNSHFMPKPSTYRSRRFAQKQKVPCLQLS